MPRRPWGSQGFFVLLRSVMPSTFHFSYSLAFVTNNLCFQATMMMKGLMGRCLNHEMELDRVRARANKTEDELNSLKAWKVGMQKKFATSENARKELEEHMETLRKVLEDKEKEVKDAKDQLCQAKEAAIHEYHDSDALLEELGTFYANGFDDAVCQAKKAYPDLEFSQLNINTQTQATAQPVASESTEDLFADDAALGDGELVPIENQAQPVDVDTHLPPHWYSFFNGIVTIL